MRLHHRIGGAFYAAGHAQRSQKVAHQRSFAGTQIAAQRNYGMAHRRLLRQTMGKGFCVTLVSP